MRVDLEARQVELLQYLLRAREQALLEVAETTKRERPKRMLALVRSTLAALETTGPDP